MGTMIQRARAGRGRLPRRALPGPSPGPQGQQRPPQPDPARRHRGHPPPVPRSRRRHRRDQHVQRAAHLAGGLRARGARRELNLAGAECARRAADAFMAKNPQRVCFVAGALGPTTRSASMSRDVNDPGRAQRHLRRARGGLLRAGARARRRRRRPAAGRDGLRHAQRQGRAVRASSACSRAGLRRVPVMVSVTITDQSGRNLSGQTIEAFWNSVVARGLLSRRHQLRARARSRCGRTSRSCRRSRPSTCRCYPNAGLPNAFGGFDETPRDHGADLRRVRAQRLRSTSWAAAAARRPTHIRPSPQAVRGCAAARARRRSSRSRASSGFEPLTLRPDTNFVNVGERTNVTGSPQFSKLILGGEYEEALRVARQQVEGGAQIIDVNMDEGMLDSDAAMTTFLNLIAAEPDIARVPVMIDSSKWSVIEAGLKCLQGKGIVNSISLKEGEEVFREHARLVRRYGAAVVVMAFDEEGQAATTERKVAICRARLPHPHRGDRLPAAGHHLRPQHPHRGHRHRGAQRLRGGVHRGHAPDQGDAARCQGQRAASATSRSRSAATTRCARPCTRRSSTTPSTPASTWASSTPASSRSTRRSRRTCSSWSRTCCSTAAPTPPSAWSPSPRR